ncbi:MAG: glycosyltransferase, partial [Bacteroidota bacterium]|nr:glycosyltransferase [Bacteroidota bacterium]
MSFFIVFTLILLAVSAVYLSLIIVFTIGMLKLEEPGSSDGNFHTRVTVIIPARNEEANMDDLLEGLAGQNYPMDLCEFILADDQSEDGTFAKAREFSGNHPLFPLKIIRTEEKGDVPSSKKKLIERAINIAAGELILTTDADVRHAPG